MILRFALDPKGIGFQRLQPHLRIALTRKIIRYCCELGIVVYSGTTFEASPLFAAVNALPQNLKTLWYHGLASARKNKLLLPADAGWDGELDVESIEQLQVLINVADVACVDESVSKRLGFKDEEISISIANDLLEVCRLDCIDHSRKLQCMLDLRQCAFGKGVKSQYILDTCFAPLLAYCDKITVVDRYAGTELCESPEGKSGLEQLIREVDGSKRPKGLQIFTAVGGRHSSSEIETAITRCFARHRIGGILSVDLYLVTDRAFGAEAHFRYVRFDEYCCCVIDPGLSILAGDELKRTHTLSVMRYESAFRMAESQLRSRWRPIRFCGRAA
jgi:hypothetical protein